MKLDIPYGKDGTIPVELADARVAAVLEPNDVAISRPIADMTNTLPAKISMNNIKKPTIFATTSRGTVWPPILTGTTAWGWISRVTSANSDLTSTWIRNILIPPPVDPAQPPRNMRQNKINCEENDHCS